MTKKLVTVLFALLVLTLPLCVLADESSVSTPNISVTTATGSATFTLKSDSKNAKIYYTTDGSDPTTADKKYTKSVKVTKSCEVRAVAYESGDYSPVGYYTVTVTKARVATPTFKATSVEGGRKVTISCSGATIYYTLDGSTPTTSDKKYTSSGIVVTESCYIKAIGVRSGYQNSAVATATVNITRLSAPTVKKSTSGGKTVYKLSGPVSGCTYYYTTNGSTPTAKTSSSCKKYSSSGISVTKDCTIKFIACKSGYAPSKVYEVDAEYDAPDVAAPKASVSNVINGKKITLTSSTSGAAYYYTLDGSTPTTSDKKYTSSGIIVSEPGNTYIRLLAVKSGYSSKVYQISVSLSQLSRPKASAVSSSSSTSTQYKLTGPSGSSIYYTTNGSTPTTSSKKVSSGSIIKVSSNCTLKMIACKAGYAPSDVYTDELSYVKKAAYPTVKETKYADYNKVTLKSSTSGATILYTVNGKDPLRYGDEIKNGSTLRIEESCLLKAVAVRDGYENSDMIMYQVTLKGDSVTTLGMDDLFWTVESDYSFGSDFSSGDVDDDVDEGYFPDLDEDEAPAELEDIGGSSSAPEDGEMELDPTTKDTSWDNVPDLAPYDGAIEL